MDCFFWFYAINSHTFQNESKNVVCQSCGEMQKSPMNVGRRIFARVSLHVADYEKEHLHKS